MSNGTRIVRQLGDCRAEKEGSLKSRLSDVGTNCLSIFGLISRNSGIVSRFKNKTTRRVTIRMNKMAMAALGLGAAYLMRNKGARDKLMKQFESFSSSASTKSSTQNNS